MGFVKDERAAKRAMMMALARPSQRTVDSKCFPWVFTVDLRTRPTQ